MKAHDSRRYHRPRLARYERHFSFGQQHAHPEVVSPFGNLPYHMAGMIRNQFADPLSRGFGYQGGSGPTAQLINQATPVLNNLIGNQTNLASTITAGANSAYGGYQAAIDNFMKQLPGFQSQVAGASGAAGEATGAARTALEDAMSPLQSRASFQEASRRALAPAREGAAARGMLEGGQAQAGEQGILSDLAFNALQADDARKQQAISGVTGAAGAQGQLAGLGAQLAGLGPEAMGNLFSAYPQLAQLLSGASQLPLGAANNVMQFLQGAQNPAMNLLRMILPQVSQSSGGYQVGVLSSDRRLKRDITPDVPGLDAILAIPPASFEYTEPMVPAAPGRHYGVMAQDVAAVAPLAVQEGAGGYLLVDYAALVPILIQAVRELSAKLDERR
jgi:Chaperone of endosialidase